MKFENTDVWGFKHALRGMRNPMNSWSKSDSFDGYNGCVIGSNDMALAQKLIRAGSEHRKFMRQICISVDITAPLYWITEFDTYKVGVTRNSCSFQHKGTSKPFSIRDFQIDDQRVLDILAPPEKNRPAYDLAYPYETNQYRIYTVGDRSYKVYRNGRIFSEPFVCVDTLGRERKFEERELKPTQHPSSGYWMVSIGGRKYHEKWLVHRLVAELWIERDLTKKLEVNHIDGNKGNNSVENLEWVTHSENEKHKHKIGTDGNTILTNYLKFKNSTKIRPHDKYRMEKLYAQGLNTVDIAKIFNVSQGQVSSILRNAYFCEDHELFEICWHWEKILENLNLLRDGYLETKDYKYFRAIRQLLPSSYLYKFTATMNYENVYNMVRQRKNHKLTEWSEQFMDWAKSLPYAKELIFLDEDTEAKWQQQ